MKLINKMMIVILFIVGLQLSACAPNDVRAEKIQPAKLESIEGSDFKRVVLTEKAAERLDVQTATVAQEQVNNSTKLVIPYASIIYGLKGETWVYTNPEPLVFIRHAITIEHIEDDQVILSDGPDVGTAIVTVGVAELFGAETGVSK